MPAGIGAVGPIHEPVVEGERQSSTRGRRDDLVRPRPAVAVAAAGDVERAVGAHLPRPREHLAVDGGAVGEVRRQVDRPAGDLASARAGARLHHGAMT